MIVFIDTSGFLSVLDEDDMYHQVAKRAWRELITHDYNMVTTNYVLVETIALAQHRFGIDSVLAFQENIYPLLQVIWIEKVTHDQAANAILTMSRRRLSLVDCTSFEIMRRKGIEQVFCFDQHFKEQGFTLIVDEIKGVSS